MDALILSCGTGGGHNSAAKAIREECIRRGWSAVLLNPYTLCGANMAGMIDSIYVRLVQRFPEGFGFIYQLGELYRRLPFHSPVYFLNGKAANCMNEYLKDKKFDIVITTHLFPGEIMARLKRSCADIPPTVYVATDYTCIPFTEDTDCDAYVIPAKELIKDFVKRGIPEACIYPLGIPVQKSFRKPITRSKAKAILGLEKDIDYLLVSGGSIGAGKLSSIVKKLQALCGSKERLIVICGSNEKLYKKLQKEYGNDITLLQSTERMAEYIRASKVYFTKPGGLSSTEAAIMGTALVHLPPIPGCETKNIKFFTEHGMSLRLRDSKNEVRQTILFFGDAKKRNNMLNQQKKVLCTNAAEAICDLAQHMVISSNKVRKETSYGEEDKTIFIGNNCRG